MNKDRATMLPDTDAGKVAYEEDSQETVQSLELAIAQISMSLQESDDSVGELITAITTMAGCVQRIENQFETADMTHGTIRDAVQSESRQVQAALRQAVTAFQFYDRLSQRFQHIQDNLRAVADVIQAPELQHHSLWQDLHDKMRSLYSLEQEQHMYQALVNGLSAQDVRQSTAPAETQSSSDIKLFQEHT